MITPWYGPLKLAVLCTTQLLSTDFILSIIFSHPTASGFIPQAPHEDMYGTPLDGKSFAGSALENDLPRERRKLSESGSDLGSPRTRAAAKGATSGTGPPRIAFDKSLLEAGKSGTS